MATRSLRCGRGGGAWSHSAWSPASMQGASAAAAAAGASAGQGSSKAHGAASHLQAQRQQPPRNLMHLPPQLRVCQPLGALVHRHDRLTVPEELSRQVQVLPQRLLLPIQVKNFNQKPFICSQFPSPTKKPLFIARANLWPSPSTETFCLFTHQQATIHGSTDIGGGGRRGRGGKEGGKGWRR